MNYKTFMETLKTELQKQFGNDIQVTASEITKNNNIVLPSIIIQKENRNISPCIYVDKFFHAYQNGEITINDIVQNIIYLYQKNMPAQNFDTGIVLDYSRARKYLRGRFINTAQNTDLLATLPHREFLDLSLTYCIELPNMGNDTYGSIQISNRYLDVWGITEEELYEQMQTNMEEFEEGILENLADTLCNLMPELDLENAESNFMYILTNKSKCNGAIQMLNTKLLQTVAEIFGSDIMLLPSSIHEMLLVPAKGDMENSAYLAEIVKNVNDTQVEPNEILSYHVYRYDSNIGSIRIVG